MAKSRATSWIGESLTGDEVGGLARAFDAGLARLSDDEQSIEIVGFSGPNKRWQLYGCWHQNAYWSWREMFVQLAFASELVLDHGWAAAHVMLETGLDVAVYPTPEHPLLLADAKTDVGKLDYLMALFNELSEDPAAHAAPTPHTTEENAVRKYRVLQRERPELYVEVAPGWRQPWDLQYEPSEAQGPRISFSRSKAIPNGDCARPVVTTQRIAPTRE
jgi:hypothetical protein